MIYYEFAISCFEKAPYARAYDVLRVQSMLRARTVFADSAV